MPNDPILDAIVGRASSGVAVADDDPILTAIQGRSSAPAATEEDPILTSLRTRQSTQKPIASAEMIGKYARDNNATIRQAHEYFRSQGFSIPGDEGTAEQQTPSAPRIITLPPGQTRTVKPTKLLDQPPFEAPSMTEIVGNALPDWSAPVLAAGEKYAVQPFERMAAAGAEADGQIARLRLEVAAQRRMAERGELGLAEDQGHRQTPRPQPPLEDRFRHTQTSRLGHTGR